MAVPQKEASSARNHVLGQLADCITGIQRPHPIRVAVDGIETLGKTTLAAELVPYIEARGRHPIHVSIDNFRFPSAIRYRQGRESPEGYYDDSYDYKKVQDWLLAPFGPGGTRRYRTAAYDREADIAVKPPEQTALDDALLVVDGIFLFRPELTGAWEYRVLVDVSFEEARRRAVARDSHKHSGSQDRVQELYAQRYHPAQRAYFDIAQPRRQADVIIDNNDLIYPKLIIP